MIRVFSVKAYWKDTRRLRKEFIIATDEKEVIKKIEEKGGYRILTINENFNHLPNKHQLMKAKKYNIVVTDQTRKELRELIKEYEKNKPSIKMS